MNWAVFALCVGSLATLAVAYASWRGRGTWAGRLLAIPLLVVACMNAAAPFRGAIDSSYMGYVFGLLSAYRGVAVTFVAGSVLVGAVIAAYIAATRRDGPGLWLVAVVCGGFAFILGTPLLTQLFTDPDANVIQFGEYATIPALPATLIVGCVLVLPFALGAVWASRGALRHA